MKLSKEAKILIIFGIIYLCFAWILSWTYFTSHLDNISEGFENWHNAIAAGDIVDSNQFRLMSFWLADFFHQSFNLQIFLAYLTIRFLFTFFTLFLFHFFLLKWFNHERAFLSVTFFAAITPVTYLPFIQEADPLHIFFFLVGLWFIREKKLLLLTLLIAVATFAKETIVFLIPFYFIYNWQKKDRLKIIWESVLLGVVWMIMFYITRTAFYDGQNSALWQLPHNIATLGRALSYNPLINLHILFLPLFGVFWVLPFLHLKEKPYFFRRAAPYIILFIVLHFIFGWPEESRIIMPLAFLVIPSGLITIFHYLNPVNDLSKQKTS